MAKRSKPRQAGSAACGQVENWGDRAAGEPIVCLTGPAAALACHQIGRGGVDGPDHSETMTGSTVTASSPETARTHYAVLRTTACNAIVYTVRPRLGNTPHCLFLPTSGRLRETSDIFSRLYGWTTHRMPGVLRFDRIKRAALARMPGIASSHLLPPIA